MFETFTGVILLIVFLVPGHVWRTVESRFVFQDKRLEWEKLALGLLTRSSVIYLAVSPLLYRGWKNSWVETRPLVVSFAALLLVLLVPAVLGFMTGLAKQRKLVGCVLGRLRINTYERSEIPNAWDEVFSRLECCAVIVTLKGGDKVYGYMDNRSVASSDRDERDIYISHALQPPDANGVSAFVEKTNGIYIKGDEIRAVEFFKIDKQGVSKHE